MTHLPIELAKAREARTEAWNQYMQVIERVHTSTEFNQALTKAGRADMECNLVYDRWQAVGGTSDIESIVDAEKFLNLVEVCLTDPDTILNAKLEVDWSQIDAQDWQDQITELRNQ